MNWFLTKPITSPLILILSLIRDLYLSYSLRVSSNLGGFGSIAFRRAIPGAGVDVGVREVFGEVFNFELMAARAA
jgi:hypothetical protein